MLGIQGINNTFDGYLLRMPYLVFVGPQNDFHGLSRHKTMVYPCNENFAMNSRMIQGYYFEFQTNNLSLRVSRVKKGK